MTLDDAQEALDHYKDLKYEQAIFENLAEALRTMPDAKGCTVTIQLMKHAAPVIINDANVFALAEVVSRAESKCVEGMIAIERKFAEVPK